MRRDRVEVKRTGDQHNKSKGYSREFHSAGESHQGPIQVKGVPLVSGPSPNNLPHFGPQRMAISKEGRWMLRQTSTCCVQATFGRTSPAIFMRSSFRSASLVWPAIQEIALESRQLVLPAGRL